MKGEPKRFVHGHNRRLAQTAPTTKKCPTCEQEKTASDFYKEARKPDGLSYDCKECKKSRSSAWYEANTDRARKRNAEWQKKNPEKFRKTHLEGGRRRRARLAEVEYERVEPWAIYEREAGRCHICGKSVAKKDMSLDHLVPVSKGGDHVSLNLRLAHRRCNSSRGAGKIPAQLLLL